jgi:circadian clock protein KaiC
MPKANPLLTPKPELPPVAALGVAGLDSILHGGLPRAEMHLIQGTAGTGKTTMALRFLIEGARLGEPTLYVTLSQSSEHLHRIARSHGWSMEGIAVHELSPSTVAQRMAARQTILDTADVELAELFEELVAHVASVEPRRAVIDSVTMVQLLSGSMTRYHREVVMLRQLFVQTGCTVLALADHPAEAAHGEVPEVMFHPLCGCVINLEQEPRPYGDARRRMRVLKARGMPHNGGYHDLKIRTGEISVYPRLGAYEQPEHCEFPLLPSGVASLDKLLHGGLNLGSSCLFVGASGVGKSSLATLFACAAVKEGKRAAIFLFDERPETYITRSERAGMPMRVNIDAKNIFLRQLDPGEIAPGEFAQEVREHVEQRQTKVVVIDSILGYFAAMGTADVYVTQLHELMTYLTRTGVLLLLCGSQEGFMSIGAQNAVDVSYLSDTIIAMTFFESDATLRRALTVVKKKHGTHAYTIHEVSVHEGAVHVGDEPLREIDHLMVQQPVQHDRQES